MIRKFREYLELLWAFIVVGGSTFGGGYAIVPVLEREFIKKRGWLTMDEILDFYTIAQITPGIIAVNIATFTGCKRLGAVGGAIATIGLVLPGVCLMLLVSVFVQRFAEYSLVQHALAGVRLAVCALILDTALKLIKGLIPRQNPVGFDEGSGKTSQETGFSSESKVAFSKTEVLKKRLNFVAILISIIAFALSAVLSVSPVYIILGAGLADFLLFSPRRRPKTENTNTGEGGQ